MSLFGLKIWSSQTFWFCKSNVYNFSIYPENLKISTYSFYTVPAEMPYLQKYLTNFQKLFFLWKIRKRRYCGWKFEMHRHYSFAIATLQVFQHPEHVKFQLFPLHCPSRNAISSKAFNEFSKTFFYLKDKERRYSGWKFEMHRHFSFAIVTLQLFQHPEHVKISIFSIPLSLQKCYIFNSIYRIFKNFFFGCRDEECGYSG